MKTINTKTLTSKQKTSVLTLWNQEYPVQLKHDNRQEFDQYLASLSNSIHFLLVDDSDKIVGWAFKFDRDSRKWFAVIVDSSLHSKGFGTLLLTKLMDNEVELNGWVVDHNTYLKQDLALYKSPIDFYLKNGFKIAEDIRLELPHLSAVKVSWHSIH